MTPADLLGLEPGSYEAYCLNEAVWYFGSTVESELDKAGHKRGKGEGKMVAARQRVLDRYVGSEKPDSQKFADPAMFFK